ncbi:hypothetical protein GQ42DRAFT_123873, partial [Ramicandelaber brevisporus]
MGGDNSAPIRQRVTRACDHCRQKKVKCDWNGVICTNCQQLSLKCTFLQTAKKRGPPKGYIEVIESRLEKMEAVI